MLSREGPSSSRLAGQLSNKPPPRCLPPALPPLLTAAEPLMDSAAHAYRGAEEQSERRRTGWRKGAEEEEGLRGWGESERKGRVCGEGAEEREERERETQAPELPLMLLRPFDNSPPKERREEGGEGGERMLLC